MKYLYGCDEITVDGYAICEKGIDDMNDMESLVIISNGSNLGVANTYRMVKEALVREKNVYLISVGEIEKVARQICMLMVSYECYNVYSVEDIDDIDDEFLEMIESRKATLDEVETYVGADIAAYPDMSKMLIKIKEYINAGEANGILRYVNDNSSKLGAMAGLIDYMKSIIDELSCNADNNDEEVKRLSKLYLDKEEKLTTQLNELKKALQKADLENEMQKKALEDKESRIQTLQDEKLNLQNAVSKVGTGGGSSIVVDYTPLNVDIMVGQAISTSGRTPKVAEILYFKEVRPCKYINSFMVNLVKILQKHVNVKMLIYDKEDDFSVIYRPLPVIDMQKYINHKNELMSKYDKWVVIEPSRAIIEDVLMDTEVVIIYDRLRKKEDITIGRKVHKYWVVNSITDVKNISKIEGVNVNMERVVSYKGLSQKCISINDVREYKRMTSSGKISAYMSMVNVGENNDRVFDIIAKQCSLTRLLK